MPRNSDILKDVMTRRGLTDADVAARAGYRNGTTIYRQRVGRTRLDDRKLAKILTAIDEDPAEFGLPTIPERQTRSESPPPWFTSRMDRIERMISEILDNQRIQ